MTPRKNFELADDYYDDKQSLVVSAGTKQRTKK